MELIKFGKGPFHIFPVVKLLKENEESYKTICESWEEFGYNLGLSQREMSDLKEKLNSGKAELRDIPRDILRTWKDGHGDDANLKVLHDALIDMKLEDLAVTVRQIFGENSDEIVLPPPLKKSKRMDSECSEDDTEAGTDTATVGSVDGNLNVLDKDGYTPLLVAIHDGRGVTHIEKLLNDGANVNIKASDAASRRNAAHVVIEALIDNNISTKKALAISDKLVAKGFNLMNEVDSDGFTPLLYAMQFEDLNEKLLDWFFKNGADFNAVEKDTGYSVLLQAIGDSQNARIIRKLLDLGGNPKHVSKFKDTALHVAAKYANVQAMEIFVDLFDINEGNEGDDTPLHLLFSEKDLNYQPCLEILLGKAANFNAKNDNGYVPMVQWMMFAEGNPFPTLMNVKHQLPITTEIACTTLTCIVKRMSSLQAFLPTCCKKAQNEFTQFVSYLIKEKQGKLQLKEDIRVEKGNWDALGKTFLKIKGRTELKQSAMTCRSQLEQINNGSLRRRELNYALESNANFSIETALFSLLASQNYKVFNDVCQFLSALCRPVGEEDEE